MFTVAVMAFVLLAWTGAWSTHSGLGALFFLGVWIGAMIYALVLAFMAPWLPTQIASWVIASIWGKQAGKIALNVLDVLDIVVNGVLFIVPAVILTAALLFLYLIGLGDWLSSSFPELVPKGGILFSDAAASLWAYLALGYIGFETWSLFDRFRGMDGEKDKRVSRGRA